jgi:hypothetical protein
MAVQKWLQKDYESVGREFESLRARHKINNLQVSVSTICADRDAKRDVNSSCHLRCPSHVPLVNNLRQILQGRVQVLLGGRYALVPEHIAHQLDVPVRSRRSVAKLWRAEYSTSSLGSFASFLAFLKGFSIAVWVM